ncbi:hypothetical protein [Arcanobacterium pinnipediorum]|uniref:Uncharacterized protein n=1 Tax=Arcanobacterium pinnipediorum TaxID=1503041 RepID=A0ABY5AJ35_9ACTO|nr:hypothetical protein [Arcanobacterium pinnipediorum]USR79766.1 hypothetical protein NG665_01890 [Arcanobacterium pinnipediorum]
MTSQHNLPLTPPKSEESLKRLFAFWRGETLLLGGFTGLVSGAGVVILKLAAVFSLALMWW